MSFTTLLVSSNPLNPCPDCPTHKQLERSGIKAVETRIVRDYGDVTDNISDVDNILKLILIKNSLKETGSDRDNLTATLMEVLLADLTGYVSETKALVSLAKNTIEAIKVHTFLEKSDSYYAG